MSRPDPIEIKVNIGGDIDAALAALGLGDGEPREVWFLEDRTEGVPALPLLNAGIIVRLRRRKKKADSTVKLRPCRRSQLVDTWEGQPPEDSDYRVEGDWSRKRHVLAASYGCDLDPDIVKSAVDTGRLEAVFTAPQRAFLAACGSVGVALNALTVLEPIAASTWKGRTVGAVPQVDAERWRVGGMDFLELSIKVTTGADDAAKAQRELEDAVLGRGLQFDQNELPKTERVLTYLVGER